MKIINLLIEWIGLATVIKKKKFVYLVIHLISFKNKKNVAYKKYHSKKKKLKLIILFKKCIVYQKKKKT